MDNLPVIRLKIERRSSHPWIFQKMVEKPMQKPPPGTVVDVEDLTGAWVGRGLYNGHSRISLRVLTTEQHLNPAMHAHVPLLEFDPAHEAVINPSRHRPMLGFPERAVMCWFGDVVRNTFTATCRPSSICVASCTVARELSESFRPAW